MQHWKKRMMTSTRRFEAHCSSFNPQVDDRLSLCLVAVVTEKQENWKKRKMMIPHKNNES
jgi:hypothetical protein